MNFEHRTLNAERRMQKIASSLAMTPVLLAQGHIEKHQHKISCHCEEERRGNLPSFFTSVATVICIFIATTLHADNIRPAYLEINETEPGCLSILWKIPYGLDGKPLELVPAFPDSFTTTSLAQRVEASDGIVRKWTMVIENGELGGTRVGINGLEQTATDALVRVRLADGSSFRAVLRPTEPAVTITREADSLQNQQTQGGSILKRVDAWRYTLLIPLAWLISLSPGARQRGILLCALALGAGGITGHVLGRNPDLSLRVSSLPPEAEVKRALQGLMLNTYRAFMLQEDELIYDCLARSVEGEFLGDVFLQNREVLSMQEEDAALTLINGLDIKSIEHMSRDSEGRLHVRAQWDAYGKVHHWQHVHFRCNTYEAEVTLVPTENYWKLTRVQVLNEERVL